MLRLPYELWKIILKIKNENFEKEFYPCCDVYKELLYCRCLAMCDLDGNGCDGKICKSYGTECQNVKKNNYFKCIKKIGPTIFFDKFIKETIQIRKVFLKNYQLTLITHHYNHPLFC